MSLSVLARSSALRQQAFTHARSFHASGSARSAHDDYHHLPFAFPGDKKLSFGVKVGAYLVFGFSIPFIAAAYQMKKSSGSD